MMYMVAIVLYTNEYIQTGRKLNELFYISLYSQCAVFSGVLIKQVKNNLIKSFLLINMLNFVMLIFNYYHFIISGSSMIDILLASTVFGTITSLFIAIWDYFRQSRLT